MNLKMMNMCRHNIFWIYILDLHNNYIEDPRLLKMNPLSPARMESILENVLEETMKKLAI